MKIFFRLFTICAIVCIATIGLILSPYALYSIVLKYGCDNDYLRLKPSMNVVYGKEAFKYERLTGIYREDGSRWEQRPFKHFYIPIVKHHPQFDIIAEINKIGPKKFEYGVNYADSRHDPVVKVMERPPAKFNIDVIHQHKIFSLPFFKNYILKKKLETVWRDIFTKDLSSTFILRRYFENRSLTQYLTDLINTPYQELVYGLFIFKLRQDFFPSNYSEITFEPASNYGIVFIPPQNNERYQTEVGYILQDGIVYSIALQSRIESIQGEAIRVRFFKELKYFESSQAEAVRQYALYKKLSYRDKISNQGMSELYFAWSHDLQNENFLRELISYLERGEDNQVFLQPFYQFAYETYGTNFSSLMGNLKETAEQKKKRLESEKLKEELEAESKKQKRVLLDDFDNDEQKVEFYLQKAKDDSEESAVRRADDETEFITD